MLLIKHFNETRNKEAIMLIIKIKTQLPENNC